MAKGRRLIGPASAQLRPHNGRLGVPRNIAWLQCENGVAVRSNVCTHVGTSSGEATCNASPNELPVNKRDRVGGNEALAPVTLAQLAFGTRYETALDGSRFTELRVLTCSERISRPG